jgi:hypothetical protein
LQPHAADEAAVLMTLTPLTGPVVAVIVSSSCGASVFLASANRDQIV